MDGKYDGMYEMNTMERLRAMGSGGVVARWSARVVAEFTAEGQRGNGRGEARCMGQDSLCLLDCKCH
jgi:hypothetical protein